MSDQYEAKTRGLGDGAQVFVRNKKGQAEKKHNNNADISFFDRLTERVEKTKSVATKLRLAIQQKLLARRSSEKLETIQNKAPLFATMAVDHIVSSFSFKMKKDAVGSLPN